MRRLLLLAALFSPVCVFAQQVWEKPLAPGLVYREEVDLVAPRVIHAIRITPSSPALTLAVEPTGRAVNEAASAPTGRTTVSKLVTATGALVGINGDYFVDQGTGWNGHSLGLLVRSGELIATPNLRRSVFAWGSGTATFGKAKWEGTIRLSGGAAIPLSGLNRSCGANEAILNGPAAGQAIMQPGSFAVVLRLDGVLAPTSTVGGTVELVTDDAKNRPVEPGKAVLVVNGKAVSALKGLGPGDRIAVSMKTSGFDWERIDSAVGGGPMLVQDGEVAVADDEGFNQGAFVAARHPRSAVGRTADGDLWLVAVDGRSPVSAGASLPELASIMKRLGCVEAMNLDGGGSTDLVGLGMVLNRPSDLRERPVADALLVRGPRGDAVAGLRLVVPARMKVGSKVDLQVLDANGKPIPNAKVLWTSSGSLWIDQGGRVKVLASGSGTISAAVGGQVLTAKVVAVR